MRNLDKRLQDLERKAAPPRRLAIYQEDLSHRGMFRRGAAWRGQPGLPELLTHDQVQEDADGATIILIRYEAGDGEPVSFDFGPDTTAIHMPNNHRGDA